MSNINSIDKYNVVFPLKNGTYYDLYRVIDDKKEKYYLKLINLAKLESLKLGTNENLVYEIELLRSINNTNIIRQVDCGETIIDGQRYAFSVTAFVPGELLSNSFLRKMTFSIYETKQIISGILKALRYLHSQNEPIIFNAISPDSVLLDLRAGGTKPLLMDFSHARKLNKENLTCQINGLSPFYLAPEMFKGLYSTRTDLYAVGALMYHLVFGIEPWQKDLTKVPLNEKERVVLAERKRPLPIPNVKIFEMDDHILKIMAKALSQDVDERFQNADDFLLALESGNTINCTNFEKIDAKSSDVKPTQEIKHKRRGNGFADVAGLDHLKRRMQEEVIDIFKNPQKYKKLRVKIPNGILLYGPPGCGKSFIAEKFAEEMDCNYMYIHCSDVASPYIHGGQEKIAAVFKQAKENSPTVLFLDELDSMLADRSRHNNVSESGEVNEFLTQLNNCADDGVIVIGATNEPTLIDSAALRSGRFDIKEYVPAPSEEERELLLRLALKDIASEDVDYKKLSALTNGYVSKDIFVLVNRAALITAQHDKEVIMMDALLDAVEKSKGELPSVSQSLLKKHERLRDEFESRKKARPIGFVTYD